MVSDDDFSDIQRERRYSSIVLLLRQSLSTLDLISDTNLKFKIRKQMNQSLIDAYNIGFIDSKNETSDSIKL